ncbi:MAG: hypothetical protein NTU69_09070 [Proteobacteria bacterium]|nr:hypothetical protein [Pseudomonadota bacterium]
MTELPLTDAEANALHGTTDNDTDFKYHSPGEASYFTEGQRQRHRLLTLAKAISNSLRVYRDGELSFGVRPGSAGDGDTTYAYEGSAGNALTDDATNYIYLTAANLSASNMVTVNTTGFPLQSVTPHIPLAEIVTSAGGYGCDDITDLRSAAALALQSGMTAANANTLVAGAASNADALHIHDLPGLAAECRMFLPALELTGTNDADGTGTMSIQVEDPYTAEPLAGRYRVRCWIGTAAYGAPAAQTDFSVTTGTQLRQITADADYEVISDAAGLVVMNIDTATNATFHVMAEIDGAIYYGQVAITGN